MACRSDRRGVTLIEMLIVVAIVAVVAGVSFPSLASGLDNIRLRSAADSVTGFLNGAMSRVERKEQPIEIVVVPQERALMLYSNEPGFTRRLDLPEGIKIAGDEPRRFLLLPGGTPPAMDIDIFNQRGAHKLIHIDPITGIPQS